MNLPKWYSEYKEFIEHSIGLYLGRYLEVPMTRPLEDFKEIVIYGTQWGKRLRAILALEFYLSLTGKSLSGIRHDDDIVKLCIALEIMHAFSLIHDDLPCMDDDELRRWELTVWKKYSEYHAVLAGDMMNTLTFELIADIADPWYSQSIAKLISQSVWFYGMVGGQVEDMYYGQYPSELDHDTLIWLHGKKTGRLIEASIIAACILSGETTDREIYRNFGQKLGLAFQVKDDILDVEGTREETGKSVWGEMKGFVYLLWLDASKEILAREIIECKKIIWPLNSPKMDYLVEFIAERTR